MIKILQENDSKRDIHLFDTFAGMSKPTSNDKNIANEKAEEYFEKTKIDDSSSKWCYAPIDDVKKISTIQNMTKRKFILLLEK